MLMYVQKRSCQVVPDDEQVPSQLGHLCVQSHGLMSVCRCVHLCNLITVGHLCALWLASLVVQKERRGCGAAVQRDLCCVTGA
jgi:hypothetical protein